MNQCKTVPKEIRDGIAKALIAKHGSLGKVPAHSSNPRGNSSGGAQSILKGTANDVTAGDEDSETKSENDAELEKDGMPTRDVRLASLGFIGYQKVEVSKSGMVPGF